MNIRLLFLMGIFFSIEINAQDFYQFVLMKNGDTIHLGEDFTRTDDLLFVEAENEEKFMLRQKDVLTVYNGPKDIFMNMKDGKDKNKVHKILAYNDKYILSSYHTIISEEENTYVNLYVWDKELNLVQDRVLFNHLKMTKQSKNLELLNEKIFPYFDNCRELKNKLTQNVNRNQEADENINFLECTSKKINFENLVSSRKKLE